MSESGSTLRSDRLLFAPAPPLAPFSVTLYLLDTEGKPQTISPTGISSCHSERQAVASLPAGDTLSPSWHAEALSMGCPQ